MTYHMICVEVDAEQFGMHTRCINKFITRNRSEFSPFEAAQVPEIQEVSSRVRLITLNTLVGSNTEFFVPYGCTQNICTDSIPIAIVPIGHHLARYWYQALRSTRTMQNTMTPASPTPSTPVEFLSPKLHPLEHLSRLLSSFCNPSNEAGDDDDDDDDTAYENHDTCLREMIINPGDHVTPNTKAGTKSNAAQETDDDYELIMHIEAPTTTPTVSASQHADQPLMPILPESILKTVKSKKKTMTVVVDSGRGHRIHRILETAIFSVLVVVATMLTLRRLGHETDLNFFKSSNPSSFPIKFDFRKRSVEDVPNAESDSIVATATQVNIEPFAPNETVRQDETAQDETTLDETTLDETPQDETTQDETTQDETTLDETPQVEAEEATQINEHIHDDLSDDLDNFTPYDVGATDENELTQHEEL